MNSNELDALHIWALEQLVEDLDEAKECGPKLKKEHHDSRASAFQDVIAAIEKIKEGTAP